MVELEITEGSELKLDRLIVSLFRIPNFRDELLNFDELELAARYVGVIKTWKEIELDFDFSDPTHAFIELLKILYKNNESIFTSYLEYLFNDYASQYGFDYDFEQVLDELKTLGYVYEDNKIKPITGELKGEREIDTKLDEMLRELNPDYPKMRRGSWDALLSKNPDGLRQSVSSIREVFNHVLRQLAPNEKTRKDRLKKIFSKGEESLGSEIELIESLSKTVEKLYRVQSKRVHKTSKSFENALFSIKITEYLLYFILINRNRE